MGSSNLGELLPEDEPMKSDFTSTGLVILPASMTLFIAPPDAAAARVT